MMRTGKNACTAIFQMLKNLQRFPHGPTIFLPAQVRYCSLLITEKFKLLQKLVVVLPSFYTTIKFCPEENRVVHLTLAI